MEDNTPLTPQEAIKWEMINVNKFHGTLNEYFVIVTLGGIYPHWLIIKGGVIIDEAQYHSPVTTDFNKELACKVQAERYLNKIILATQ